MVGGLARARTRGLRGSEGRQHSAILLPSLSALLRCRCPGMRPLEQDTLMCRPCHPLLNN